MPDDQRREPGRGRSRQPEVAPAAPHQLIDPVEASRPGAARRAMAGGAAMAALVPAFRSRAALPERPGGR